MYKQETIEWEPKDEDAPPEQMTQHEYDVEDIYNYTNLYDEQGQGQLFSMLPKAIEFTKDAYETSYEVAERFSKAVIKFQMKERNWESVEKEVLSLVHMIWNHVPIAKTYKSIYDTLGE